MNKEEVLKEEVNKVSNSLQKNEIPKDNQNDPLIQVQKKLAEIKTVNDELEREQLRSEELRARDMAGGRTNAGASVDKTQEQIDAEEAAKMIKQFR